MRYIVFFTIVAALIGGFVGAIGFGVAASGVIPIKASSGHWAITEWMLHFSMRRSIATHTIGDELPALDDPALVLRGAGHYEGGCKPCHGSPEIFEPRVARAMLPPPPDLKPAATKWQPEELFYIIKHGIKFTGMPAWPTPDRDDEIIAVVAFLQALPQLDAAAYRKLVHGPGEEAVSSPALAELSGRAPTASQSCARCHGRTGEGRENAAFPRLAHQREGYTLAALDAYANDQRFSGVMQPIAAALSVDERKALAKYYADQARPAPAGPAAYARDSGSAPHESAHAQRVARGREIATHGIADQRVPACASCHGPRPEKRNAEYPRIAGQYAEYLVQQLELFHRHARGGSKHHHLMHKAATPLQPEQIRDVAAFYASLADD
ncbi:MAG TPA: c-type cytochrome, partial [Polyangiales bacterium]|nr:c-type cytochrome [Polyangiales bacterium]